MATLKSVLNKKNSKNTGAVRVFLDNSWECLGFGLRNSSGGFHISNSNCAQPIGRLAVHLAQIPLHLQKCTVQYMQCIKTYS
jgi:hypothetical protein